MTLSPAFLVTHSGGFHADELMSSVVLSKLFPAAKLIRSRDKAWLAPGPDRVIYDVGGDYNPELGIFDHHQRGAPLRPDGEPFSSFGLIWKHFGADYLRAMAVPEDHIAHVHSRFDAGFVLAIDLVDNGQLDVAEAGLLGPLSLPSLLETLKPVFDDTDPESMDRAFADALLIARAFVEARIRNSAAKLRAEAMALQAIAAAGEGRVLELPMGMPFRSAVIKAGADHLLFVVTPRSGSDWTIGGIRRDEHGFALRADLPAAWAGLSDQDLEVASGVVGAKFCHNGRFIAAASSREAALKMAELAVVEAISLG